MKTRYVLAAFLLATGCEHFKSPQRLEELEGKVDELTKEVTSLTGRPLGKKGKKGKKSSAGGRAATVERASKDHDEDEGDEKDHDKKDEDEHDKKDEDEHDKKDEDEHGKKGDEHAKADDEHDKKDDEHGKKDDEHGKKDDEHAKADDEHGKKDDRDGHDQVAERGDGDGKKRGDPAMERLLSVVAKSTGKHGAGDKPHWAYDGKAGPKAWGKLDPEWSKCSSGKAQSPIDILPRAGNASPIEFHYRPTPASIIDNGHTLQVNFEPGSTIDIDRHTYALVQFHFHTPSEHSIAGEHYPLELHLVHKDVDGKLAVIGVLFDAGAESKVLPSLWAQWPRKVDTAAKLPRPFDPSLLLPDNRKVFRYSGSLTTPPCSEGVVWNVMRRTLSDSRGHIDEFIKRYPLNARDVQPLNERKIE